MIIDNNSNDDLNEMLIEFLMENNFSKPAELLQEKTGLKEPNNKFFQTVFNMIMNNNYQEALTEINKSNYREEIKLETSKLIKFKIYLDLICKENKKREAVEYMRKELTVLLNTPSVSPNLLVKEQTNSSFIKNEEKFEDSKNDAKIENSENPVVYLNTSNSSSKPKLNINEINEFTTSNPIAKSTRSNVKKAHLENTYYDPSLMSLSSARVGSRSKSKKKESRENESQENTKGGTITQGVKPMDTTTMTNHPKKSVSVDLRELRLSTILTRMNIGNKDLISTFSSLLFHPDPKTLIKNHLLLNKIIDNNQLIKEIQLLFQQDSYEAVSSSKDNNNKVTFTSSKGVKKPKLQDIVSNYEQFKNEFNHNYLFTGNPYIASNNPNPLHLFETPNNLKHIETENFDTYMEVDYDISDDSNPQDFFRKEDFIEAKCIEKYQDEIWLIEFSPSKSIFATVGRNSIICLFKYSKTNQEKEKCKTCKNIYDSLKVSSDFKIKAISESNSKSNTNSCFVKSNGTDPTLNNNNSNVNNNKCLFANENTTLENSNNNNLNTDIKNISLKQSKTNNNNSNNNNITLNQLKGNTNDPFDIINLNEPGKLYDINIVCFSSFYSNKKYITSLQFSLDEKSLFISSIDNTIKQYSFEGLLLKTFYHHTDIVSSLRVISSNLIISGGIDKKIILQDFVEENRICILSEEIRIRELVVTKIKDSNSLILSKDPIDILIVIPASKNEVVFYSYQIINPCGNNINNGFSNSNSNKNNNNNNNNETTNTNKSTGKGFPDYCVFSKLNTTNDGKLKLDLKVLKRLGEIDPIISTCVTQNYPIFYNSPNSNNNNSIKLENYNLPNHFENISNKDYLIINTNKIHASINLYDLSNFELINKYYGHSQTQFVVKCCFGGKKNEYILCGSEDSKIFVWHIRSSNSVFVINGHTGCINALVTPEFGVVISVSDDHSIRVWSNYRIKYFDTSVETKRRLNSVNSIFIGSRDHQEMSSENLDIHNIDIESNSYPLLGEELHAYTIDQNIIEEGSEVDLEEEDEGGDNEEEESHSVGEDEEL